jgi:hypothetical protein
MEAITVPLIPAPPLNDPLEVISAVDDPVFVVQADDDLAIALVTFTF